MIYAEILAGGSGSRMGNTEMPKQFLSIGNKPIIIHTIEKFILQPRFKQIVVVTPEKWIAHTQDIIAKYIPAKMMERIAVCAGGKDRNESIMNGLKFIENSFGITEEDVVVTHDAVRPFITSRILEDNIKMALEYGATDTVVPAFDTIIKSESREFVGEIPIRDHMYQGQTPQSFNIKLLMDLYDSLSNDEKDILTDAAKICTLKGKQVKLVDGESFNMKVTTQYDLKIANLLVDNI